MEFYEKLNLLMSITNTKNSSLAHYLKLDPSYISRLRRGERKFPNNIKYIDMIALYFTKMLKIESEKDSKVFKENIIQWLSDENDESIDSILIRYVNLGNEENKKNIMTETIDKSMIQKDFEVYFGIEGKREAALKFLNLVIAEEKPQTLLLFSDENLSWLIDDLNFFREWSILMHEVIEKGNEIEIIHTITRNFDEMLSAIRGWMPFYLTGHVKPYYYPKKRDGVFQRTLFVASNTAAIEATSVFYEIKNTANILTFDKKTIDALKREYLNYKALCKPLAEIFTEKTKIQYYMKLFEFEKTQRNTVFKSSYPSILTMPIELYNSISDKQTLNLPKDLIDIYEENILKLPETLNKYSFTDILESEILETKEDFSKNKSYNFLSGKDLYDSREELLLHLKNCIYLLENHPDYNLMLLTGENVRNYNFYLKEGVGLFVWDANDNGVVIYFDEENIVEAFWDYINYELKLDKLNKDVKEKVINTLKEKISF
jgi:hypothetical protein